VADLVDCVHCTGYVKDQLGLIWIHDEFFHFSKLRDRAFYTLNAITQNVMGEIFGRGGL